MKRLLAFYISLSIICVPAIDCMAESSNVPKKPTYEFFLRDCTGAVNEAKKGHISNFYNSYCNARFEGFLEGISWYALTRAKLGDESDNRLNKEFSVCMMPIDKWRDKYPQYNGSRVYYSKNRTLFYAMDFLDYVKSLTQVKGNVPQEILYGSTANQPISDFFRNYYKCFE